MSKDNNSVSKDTPRELVVFTSHTADVLSLAFSPDGSKLASTGYDGDAIIWDVASRSVERKIHHDELSLWSVAFSSDGKSLACTDWKKLYYYDVTTGELLRVLRGAGGRVCLESDTTFRVQANSSDVIILRSNLRTKQVDVLVNKKARFSGHQMSPSGRLLAVAFGDAVYIIDVNTSRRLAELSRPADAPDAHYASIEDSYGAVFSPDESLMALSTYHNVFIWDVASGEHIGTLPHGGTVAFSPDGSYLAVEIEGNLLTYRTKDWTTSSTFDGPKVDARVLGYSPDGRILVTGEHNGKVRFWDTISGKLLDSPIVHTAGIGSLQISDTEPHINSRHYRMFTAEWDLERSELKALSPLPAHVKDAYNNTNIYSNCAGLEPPQTFATSPDGRIIATSDGTSCKCCLISRIILRDAVTNEPLHELRAIDGKGFVEEVMSVVFSQDSGTLALGHMGFAVSLWDVKTGERKHFIRTRRDSVSTLAFSPDGQTLATGTDYDPVIELFDIPTGKQKRLLYGHTNSVLALAYSSDGNTLFSGSSDGSIKMWNPHSGQLFKTFVALVSDDPNQVHPDWVVYTPDGQFNCSPGAKRHLRWKIADDFLPV